MTRAALRRVSRLATARMRLQRALDDPLRRETQFPHDDLPGAEAPKRSRPITAPRSPTYSRQPRVTPASTASSRDIGRQHGSTVRLGLRVEELEGRERDDPRPHPAFRRAGIAPRAAGAPRSRCPAGRSAAGPSRRFGQDVARRAARRRRWSRATRPGRAASAGSAPGRPGPRCATANRHAATVSFPSAGRMTVRPGIARRAMSCSTG